MQPVWVLSVDLQTKTATFQSGLSDAARTARSTFRDIGAGAAGMGESVARGSLDVRHAIGLVDNTIRGAHSMAMVDLIRMFSQSAIVMTALPFAMTAAGFALVGEIVMKGVQAYRDMLAAQEKLREDTSKMGTAFQDVWSGLDNKIIEAKKEADDLAGNHLAALHEQLMLIDRTSLEDLRHSFESVAKEAETFFGDLQSHWYEMGTGSAGAKHALDDFQTKYDALLASGQDEKASGLLHGTLAQAQEVLRLQQIADAGEHGNRYDSDEAYQKAIAADKALAQLKQLGAGYTSKEIEAQRALVDALNAQVGAETRIAEIKKLDTGNAVTSYHKGVQSDNAANAKARAEAEDKAERGFTENFKTYENERIGIAQAGSTQRVAILQRAMADAAALYGTNSDIYRHYAQAEVAAYNDAADKTLEAIAREIEQENKLRSDAAREAADNALKMGELRIAAEKQAMALEESTGRMTSAQRTSLQKKIADDEFNLKMRSLQQQIDGLNKSEMDYQNKLKSYQDKEKQLVQQHANEIAGIREKAETETNKKLAASYQQFTSTVAGELTKSIMGHQTWAHMIESLGDQAISSMIKNGIQYAMANRFRQESDAKAAGSAGFKWGMEHGGPAAPVLAPTIASIAFAGALAFSKGGIVPGMGTGDIVPAMLTPGEGVVPKGVMEGLSNIARNGGFNQAPSGPISNIHIRPTYNVNTIDGDGMEDALEKHSDQLTRHFKRTLREMNY